MHGKDFTIVFHDRMNWIGSIILKSCDRFGIARAGLSCFGPVRAISKMKIRKEKGRENDFKAGAVIDGKNRAALRGMDGMLPQQKK